MTCGQQGKMMLLVCWAWAAAARAKEAKEAKVSSWKELVKEGNAKKNPRTFSVVFLVDDRREGADTAEGERLSTSTATVRRHLNMEDVDSFLVVTTGCATFDDCDLGAVFDFVPRDKLTHVPAAKALCHAKDSCGGVRDDTLLSLGPLGLSRLVPSTHMLLLDEDAYAISSVSSETLLTLDGRARALNVRGCDFETRLSNAAAGLALLTGDDEDNGELTRKSPAAAASDDTCSNAPPQLLSTAAARHLLSQLERHGEDWYERTNATAVELYDAFIGAHRSRFADVLDLAHVTEVLDGAAVPPEGSLAPLRYETFRPPLFFDCRSHGAIDCARLADTFPQPEDDDDDDGALLFQEDNIPPNNKEEVAYFRVQELVTYCVQTTLRVLLGEGRPAGLDWRHLIIVLGYLAPVFVCSVYMTHRLVSMARAATSLREPHTSVGRIPVGSEPAVTVQICCYNEGEVVEKTIDAACAIDWPAEKLCVKVLDDSTDKACQTLIERVAARWRQRGMDVRRCTRPNRVGYKAGSLMHNHAKIETEFVALYDADHRADPAILRLAMPHFFDDGDAGVDAKKNNVGLVQAPWGYYNGSSNVLTACDTLNLDTAFSVEQTCRARLADFCQFNGTGGVWRVKAVDGGGGWRYDTVTEDLDLSYKAYIAGYRMRFLQTPVQELEVPSNLEAFKSQKYRWSKGYGQVTRKSLLKFLTAKELSVAVKIEAFFHLTGGVQYASVVCIMVWIPILSAYDLHHNWVVFASFYPAAVWFLLCLYTSLTKKDGGTTLQRLARVRYAFAAIPLAYGISVHQTVSMIEGWFSNDATFIRTPKEGSSDSPSDKPKTLDLAGQVVVDVDQEANVATCAAGVVSISVPPQEQFLRYTAGAELAMILYTTLAAGYVTHRSFLDALEAPSLRAVISVFAMVPQVVGVYWIMASPIVTSCCL